MEHDRASLVWGLRRRAFKAPPPRGPSFATRHAQARRVRRALLSLGADEPVWSVNDKDTARDWASRLGVPAPAMHGRYPSVDRVDWAALPPQAIVKPARGAGGLAVYALHRRDSGWFDLGRRRPVTPHAMSSEVGALVRAGAVSPEMIVEQLIVDPSRPDGLPTDWKAYTFFGEVGLFVAVADVSVSGEPRRRYRAFDTSFNDLGRDANPSRQFSGDIPPPTHRNELVDLAARVSAAVPRPFLRVDLYDGVDGPVFGEITPDPGGAQRFRRDLDRRLGELWDEAEARVLLRAARSGLLDPADEPLPEAHRVRS